MSQEKDEKINMIEMSTQGIIDQYIKPNYTEEIEKRKANINKNINIKKALKNREDIMKNNMSFKDKPLTRLIQTNITIDTVGI